MDNQTMDNQTMDNQIGWRVELCVQPGQFAALLMLTDGLRESASLGFGCLSYVRFIGAKGNSINVYERYLNSDAAMEHLCRFEKHFVARCPGPIERKNFTVCGTPSRDLNLVLERFNPVYLALVQPGR